MVRKCSHELLLQDITPAIQLHPYSDLFFNLLYITAKMLFNIIEN